MQQIKVSQDCDDYDSEEYWKEQLEAVLQVLQELVRSAQHACRRWLAMLSYTWPHRVTACCSLLASQRVPPQQRQPAPLLLAGSPAAGK